MSESKLNQDFVNELAAYCFKNEKVASICLRHLKYHYLFDESQKIVFKSIFEHYNVTSNLPTIGTIGQIYSTNKDVINTLSKIKRVVYDKDQVSNILSVFETFIKESRYVVLYEKIGPLYNEGRSEEGLELMIQESQEIKNFTLVDTLYTTVFKGYEQRSRRREEEKDTVLLEKCTWGIHELDKYTFGGINKGTSGLLLARSGAGKSTFLRWVGMANARLGRRVVHFQAEGTEQEVLDAYDAGWTGIGLRDVEYGNIPKKKQERIELARKSILANGGEIYVYASERFDSMTLEEAREILLDISENIGPVDIAIWDYLELFTLKGEFSNSESGERRRRERIANGITNIAVELKIACVTATQTMDISPELQNNPLFVLTRHHISEFKNVVKPFSYFMTHNQTRDEYEEEIVRIYCDKFRKYKSGQIVKIYQSRSNSRYYDSKRTIETFFKD